MTDEKYKILVFQCCNWKAETWSNLEDTVHHAAWSQCGNHLIFATKNKVSCNFVDHKR